MAHSKKALDSFVALVWDYYERNGRHNFAWRHDISPYRIVISEVMLQQTQVSRIEKYFPEFLGRFPDFDALSRASNADMLSAWQGLGYNRRGLYLRELANEVMTIHGGILPADPEVLKTLPGIGKATAGSLAAFAYNIPTVFIETNIRRVFIHHFFPWRTDVSDREIEVLVAKSVSPTRAREWYWALMDYGTHLAKMVPNPNKKSIHHKKQPAFKGSNREVRGAIVRLFARHKKSLKLEEIQRVVGFEPERMLTALDTLVHDGFLVYRRGRFFVKE